MALDAVTAALAAPPVARLVVVTDDPAVAAAVRALGAAAVPDTPAAGLNAALRHGAAHLDRSAAAPVAALAADLPALRPAELAAALAAAGRTGGAGFVPDAAGTGTVLLAAATGAALRPRFGPGSAAAHRAAGVAELAGDWPALRRDVDTPADLAAAAALGLGRHTAALFALDGRPGRLR
jgi:2-phospho-L-lactate guanylyltransferase